MRDLSVSRHVTILSPTAILGYGFPESSFRAGLARHPDVIAVDAGSTDPGPYYLGSGESFTNRDAVKRDLLLMIEAGLDRDIPILIGTAGGAGAEPHLAWCLEIVDEVLCDLGRCARVADIASDQNRDSLISALHSSRITELGPVPPLTQDAIEKSSHIVAQMGVEPIIEALDQGAQIIVTGRCYDPAVFAAVPIRAGFSEALSLHLGKILECAAIAATPGSGSDCMIGVIDESGFTLEALSPERKCTVTSVAAHTLYEKTDPRYLPGPGGVLDLSRCHFEQMDERRVRVTGTQLQKGADYTIKLEGAQPVGFRTISIAGIRAPDLIQQLDVVLKDVRDRVFANFESIDSSEAQLLFRVYGQNGVMGDLEPLTDQRPHEVGLVIEVVAKTQSLADTVCSFARSTLLHFGYPGRQSTAGNLAFPYSPSDISHGVVYEFSVYHLMIVDDPVSPFPMRIQNLGTVR